MNARAEAMNIIAEMPEMYVIHALELLKAYQKKHILTKLSVRREQTQLKFKLLLTPLVEPYLPRK